MRFLFHAGCGVGFATDVKGKRHGNCEPTRQRDCMAFPGFNIHIPACFINIHSSSVASITISVWDRQIGRGSNGAGRPSDANPSIPGFAKFNVVRKEEKKASSARRSAPWRVRGPVSRGEESINGDGGNA